ncbi:MAG TPA: hypothetical protein VLL27_01520 [Solirubrobacterales bacterium]|nr:hypothetical protein [Solirubrobacterales bacterium]
MASPRDLDFVIVYDKKVVLPARANGLRLKLKDAVGTVSSLPCDVTLFTQQENALNRFDVGNGRRLWPQSFE